MSEEDWIKWQQRYAENSYRKTNPVTLVQDWLPRITPGRALDVACGAGRNAIAAAEAGFEVDAIDISSNGLKLARQDAEARGLAINWIEQDLDDHYEFACGYDLIMVMWYVDLPLISKLCDCLVPGGYLVCEEHLQTETDVIGPENPAFRVAPGALREAAGGLEILHYLEAVEPAEDDKLVASAQLVARLGAYRRR